MLESLFNKVAVAGLEALLKIDCNTGFFCEVCEIFKNTFFYRALSVAASALL